jgi:hypothetical protein
MNDKMSREAERRARWADEKEHAEERRAAYLRRKAEKLPKLVELQERMLAGESAFDVMREDERPWLKN